MPTLAGNQMRAVLGEVVQQPLQGLAHAMAAFGIERAALDVMLRQDQRLEHDFVVIGGKRLLLEEIFRVMRRFVGIAPAGGADETLPA